MNRIEPSEYMDSNYLRPDRGRNKITPYDAGSMAKRALRCPHCHKSSVFEIMGDAFAFDKELKASFVKHKVCMKKCPNHDCNSFILYCERSDGKGYEIWPPERLGFSSYDIPEELLRTLEEAVTCHAAGAYRAAAMMVRRLLEELCKMKQAEGANLHERLKALRAIVVLPEELFDAMTELKALGNDAAHVEARQYTDIGRNEAEVSIELAKEILKAVFQLRGLIDKLKLRPADAE